MNYFQRIVCVWGMNCLSGLASEENLDLTSPLLVPKTSVHFYVASFNHKDPDLIWIGQQNSIQVVEGKSAQEIARIKVGRSFTHFGFFPKGDYLYFLDYSKPLPSFWNNDIYGPKMWFLNTTSWQTTPEIILNAPYCRKVGNTLFPDIHFGNKHLWVGTLTENSTSFNVINLSTLKNIATYAFPTNNWHITSNNQYLLVRIHCNVKVYHALTGKEIEIKIPNPKLDTSTWHYPLLNFFNCTGLRPLVPLRSVVCYLLKSVDNKNAYLFTEDLPSLFTINSETLKIERKAKIDKHIDIMRISNEGNYLISLNNNEKTIEYLNLKTLQTEKEFKVGDLLRTFTYNQQKDEGIIVDNTKKMITLFNLNTFMHQEIFFPDLQEDDAYNSTTNFLFIYNKKDLRFVHRSTLKTATFSASSPIESIKFFPYLPFQNKPTPLQKMLCQQKNKFFTDVKCEEKR